jgi:stress response protein SCP2
MDNMNKIFLTRKNKVIPPASNKSNITKAHIATLNKNIESLGFTFDKKLIKAFDKCSIGDFKEFGKGLVETLKQMVGANVQYKPMYPNFPEQVMKMDEAELYINAIVHYIDSIALGTPDPWLPEYPVEKRPKFKDGVTFKVIKLGTEEEFFEIFKNLFNAKVSLSPKDKMDIETVIDEYLGRAIEILPDVIPNKENLAYIIMKFKSKGLLSDTLLTTYFKTATDVLRLVTAMSGGDVSLAQNTKFISLKRSDRKLILRLLESMTTYLEEDMSRNKDRWVRLGERLHPGEFQNRYPKTFRAFQAMRENKTVPTFNSKIEKFYTELEDKQLLELLSSRPGEFARRLDRTLRVFKTKPKTILNKFAKIAEDVSVTVLLQVRTHFWYRNDDRCRSVFPKGNIAKAMLLDKKLPEMSEDVWKEVVDICDNALITIFAKKEKMGKVYIDEALKDCPVPFALRSASNALKTITRGTHIKLDKGNTIRLFVHWKNVGSTLPTDYKAVTRDRWGCSDNGRVDVDLSALFLDKNYKYKEHVSYTNLKSSGYEAYHSGDITSAPRGAVEFIDIDIPSALKHGARYVVMNVNVYTSQTYNTIPECFAGCMIRQGVKSGEIFEPQTVMQKFDLTAESLIAMPAIFDLEARELIWCDMALKKAWDISYGWGWGGNNVENNVRGLTATTRTFVELKKPTLYDLFTLHAKARGKIVRTKSEADIVFGLYKGDVTAYDIEKIASEYM